MGKDKNTMLHSLLKFKNIFICLCLVLLLPMQAQAEGNLDVTVKSPTNPDHIFTGKYEIRVRGAFYSQFQRGGSLRLQGTQQQAKAQKEHKASKDRFAFGQKI